MTGGSEPPEESVRRARDRARELGRSVFLFHDGRGWTVEADIGSVPMAAGVREVAPDPRGEETDNCGGC
ncbi:MAG TPA: hypothetical protein VKA48_08860 [Gammaproteobacteria bacterium]|nr:hypothetical protein [Gammaproteobacteria bacterium]